MILSVASLLVLGFGAIYSVALSQPATEFLAVKKQAIALLAGVAAFLLVLSSHHRVLEGLRVHLYVFGLLLLVGVLVFGVTARGTTGWFDLGFVNVQPVEFMKLALVVFLARFFSGQVEARLSWKAFLFSGLFAGVPTFLVLLQPDLGSAVVLLGAWVLFLPFVRAQKFQVVLVVIGLLVGGMLGWNLFLADYQKARLTAFLEPAADPLGAGYNVAQATIAIGSGQFMGRGLGFGSQSQLRFLPEAETDFVLAVLGEELGFFGLLIVFGLFALLFWRILFWVNETRDRFTSYLILGVGCVLFIQFVINAGMNLGLLPVTGITLPFVSYGGSSLFFFLLMFGVVESALTHTSTF